MIWLILTLLGLVTGSFVNALVWRLRQQLPIGKERSMCPKCRHVLAPKDLVPVVSWLWLKGRCRYCRQPISPEYPLVELAVAALFIISYIWWPVDLSGAEIIRFSTWLVFVVGFAALAIYDLKWMELPHKIVYPLIGVALAQWLAIWLFDGFNGQDLVNIGLGALVGGGLFYLLFQLSGGKWIGGGDVKLGFLLGLIVADPLQAWLLLFLAALMGSLVTLPLMAAGKASRRSRIPFGPFLLAAGFIVVLFGPPLTSWLDRVVLL